MSDRAMPGRSAGSPPAPSIEDLRALQRRFRSFVEEHVIPAEPAAGDMSHGPPRELVERLREAARDAGVFAPTAPVEYGGMALTHREQAVALEEAGRSLLGPVATHCAAPDEGNILLLDKVADSRQRTRYLEPLARGEVRSAFAMTEPAPGAGSDPEGLLTQAVRHRGGWLISGRKWFITGADGAGFVIVMARTGERATMFLVDSDNPGMRVTRRIGSVDSGFAGGHCDLQLDDCLVMEDAVLGEVDRGYDYAQLRLAPARLTHCMRWLGAARRSHEVAVRYAAGRPMFGTVLADLGMAQQLIADNEVDIAASRALVREAADALDAGAPARQETSVAKIFVAEATFRIVDRSMQLAGAYGVSTDSVISRLFTEIRPFRIYDGPSEVHRRAVARRAVHRSETGLPGDW